MLHPKSISNIEAFAIANRFLGWGDQHIDGKGALWFVGIEEAKEWTPDSLLLDTELYA